MNPQGSLTIRKPRVGQLGLAILHGFPYFPFLEPPKVALSIETTSNLKLLKGKSTTLGVQKGWNPTGCGKSCPSIGRCEAELPPRPHWGLAGCRFPRIELAPRRCLSNFRERLR